MKRVLSYDLSGNCYFLFFLPLFNFRGFFVCFTNHFLDDDKETPLYFGKKKKNLHETCGCFLAVTVGYLQSTEDAKVIIKITPPKYERGNKNTKSISKESEI